MRMRSGRSLSTSLRTADPFREGLAEIGLRPGPHGGAAELLLPGGAEGRTTLGQYRLLGRLGAGGMSRVYKAEHLLMKRVVALKVLSPHLVQDPASQVRFRQEAQAAGRLCHPNIVTAHDAAEVDGVPFLVMEYVDGLDLDQLVGAQGPLPVALACECIRQAALGLQHAHERGFVHGDIKPSNLLLEHGGLSGPRVKLLDLGLARLAGVPLTDPDTPAESCFVGTPDYMAPEQSQNGHTADIRSDLYSLGCTFYYLLTGQVPYPGHTAAEKLLRHQLDPVPSPAERRPDIPPQVASVIACLMAKDPAGRFAFPADLAAVLQAWLFENRSPFFSPALPSPPVAVGIPSALDAGLEPEPVILPFPARDRVAQTKQKEIHPNQRSFGFKIAAAIVVGLLVAWVARRSARPATPPITWAEPGGFLTIANRPGRTYATLESALAAAHDGDTVVVHGSGLFFSRPLSLRSKALTLKAAPGSRPRIQLDATDREAPWRPLLFTDRSLVVEGLELRRGSPDRSPAVAETAHLLYSAPGRLRLVRCRLLAPHASALLVCRDTQRLEMLDCELVARTSACCVEVSPGVRPTVRLSGSTIQVKDPGGAALVVWAPEERQPASVRLHLEGNTFAAGRVAALAGLAEGVEVLARNNRFAFREAFLGYVGFPGEDGWRRATSWQGGQNVYQAAGDWLHVDGKPAGVRSLEDLHACWRTHEPGSREEPSVLARDASPR
jgi:serine/threonine protein kinase